MKAASGAPGAARGYISIVVSNLVFAVGFSFVAAIDEALSVWQLTLLRGAVFMLALLPWAVRHAELAKGSDRKLLLLRGGLGTAMSLCLLAAITMVPLSVATLLGKTTPLWELLMLWLLFALRPHLGDLLLMPVAILGLVLILHPEGHLDLMTLGYGALVLALAAGLLNSLEFITLRRLRGSDPPHTINLWYSAVMIVVALPFALLQPWPDVPKIWLFAGMYCLCSLAGQSLLASGMHHTSPTFASVAALLVPVFATVIDWAVFGQLLSGVELAGIILILVPAALIARAEGRHAGSATENFRWQWRHGSEPRAEGQRAGAEAGVAGMPRQGGNQRGTTGERVRPAASGNPSAHVDRS
jgi:drug/metabolite transporter (DMT)-like permease